MEKITAEDVKIERIQESHDVKNRAGGPPVRDRWHVRFAHRPLIFEHAQKYTTFDFKIS